MGEDGWDLIDLFGNETEEERKERKREEYNRRQAEAEGMARGWEADDAGSRGCLGINTVVGLVMGAVYGFQLALRADVNAGEPSTLRAIAIVIGCGVAGAGLGAASAILLPSILSLAFSAFVGAFLGGMATIFYCAYNIALAQQIPQSVSSDLLLRCLKLEVYGQGAMIGAIVAVVFVILLGILRWTRKKLRGA